MLALRTFTNEQGYEVKAIGAEQTNTGHFYYTAMSWMSDSRHLVASASIEDDLSCTFVLVDTESGRCETVVERGSWAGGIVSPDDWLYYLDGAAIRGIDLRGKTRRVVSELPKGGRFYEPLSVSADGRTMGVYWQAEGKWYIGLLDIASGAITASFVPGFAEPYPVANHAMVNPVYKKLVFFAHEGKTEHIPDRIWVWDSAGGKADNIYPQRRLPDGAHGDYVGHEMWAGDGEGLYWVQYGASPIKPTGVYYADKRRGWQAEWINGDYKYWHAAPSPDGRWVVADTHERPGKVVLIDLQSRQSRLLAEIGLWWSHPGHPHPSFSPDSRKVTYTFADQNQSLWIGIIEMEAGAR